MMDDVIAGSHSSYDTYDTCPRMYQAKHVTKEVKFVQGPEAAYGDAVHKALENYLKYGAMLPLNMRQYLPFAKAVAARPGEKLAENKYAVGVDRQPCGYFEKGKVWLRSNVDVVVLRDTSADIFDWKTGKMKDDPAQLSLYAAEVFAHHPNIKLVSAGYVWLKDRLVSPPLTFSRHEIDKVWDRWEARRVIIARAHELDHFPPKPSGLCNGWCEVQSCKFWKPKRGAQ